jgi:hypothetical protein
MKVFRNAVSSEKVIGGKKEGCGKKNRASVAAAKGLRSTARQQNVKMFVCCNNQILNCHGGGLRATIYSTSEYMLSLVADMVQFNITVGSKSICNTSVGR